MNKAPKPSSNRATYAIAIYNYMDSLGPLGTRVPLTILLKQLPVAYPTIKWKPESIAKCLSNNEQFVFEDGQWRLASMEEYMDKTEAKVDAAVEAEPLSSERKTAPPPRLKKSHAAKLYEILDAIGKPATVGQITKYTPTVYEKPLTKKQVKHYLHASLINHGYAEWDGDKYWIASYDVYVSRQKRDADYYNDFHLKGKKKGRKGRVAVKVAEQAKPEPQPAVEVVKEFAEPVTVAVNNLLPFFYGIVTGASLVLAGALSWSLL